MEENVNEIFDYLPIRREIAEEKYINYLWQAAISLDGGDREGRPFAVMPIHLLFMLAIQYKAVRIAREYKPESDEFLSLIGGRSTTQLLSEKRSVFDFGLIKERTLPEILKIIGLNLDLINKVKQLVDDRNDNLAHAKGSIEPNPESKIQEYVDTLLPIQNICSDLNQRTVYHWLTEIQPGDDMEDFLEARFLGSGICPNDFPNILTGFSISKQIDKDQFEQTVNVGLKIAYNQTIEALREMKINVTDIEKRKIVIDTLMESGEDQPTEKEIDAAGDQWIQEQIDIDKGE